MGIGIMNVLMKRWMTVIKMQNVVIQKMDIFASANLDSMMMEMIQENREEYASVCVFIFSFYTNIFKFRYQFITVH